MENVVWMAVGMGTGLYAEYGLKDGWLGGLLGNLVLGAIGAFMAVWLLGRYDATGMSGVNLWSLVAAFVGAAAMLWAGRVATASKTLN